MSARHIDRMNPAAYEADLGTKIDACISALNELRTTVGELVTLANEIKADHNAHCADATVHNAADTTNTTSSDDATAISYSAISSL